jgi:SnoaL-like domain
VIAGRDASERLAIEELIDDYARQADIGDIHAQSLLFVEDARMLLFLEGDHEATEVLHGRAQISPVFAALRRFDQRMNLNGQRSVRLLGRNRATCESYSIAHHVGQQEGGHGVLITYVRFVDDLVKHAGEWRFRERQLHILLRERRALDS